MWEADRTNGILYWAYDDSITEETDPNCAKWFSINGIRHLVAECKKVPNVEVDGLSVFSIKTDYSGTTLAALDAEGVASPTITSGQAVPPATYVIKYDGNGATGGTAPASQNKTQYTDITLATNSGGLTRIGYRFTGWNTAPAGTGTTYSPGDTYSADKSVTLYAKWEAVDAVTFSRDGAVNSGDTVELTPPKSDATIHYQINGTGETAGAKGQPVTVTLYNASNPPQNTPGEAAGIPEGGNVTITAYAVYADGARSEVTTGEYRLNQYAVDYEGNGNGDAVGNVPDPQTFYSGGSVAIGGGANRPERIGYRFTGWNTAPAGTGTTYSAGAAYSADEDETLYAQWEANTYTVNFVGNGGGGSMDDQPFTYDTTKSLTKNTFTRAGYTFEGWKDNKNKVYTDEEKVSNLTAVQDGIVTLTAQWGCQLQDSAQVPSGYTSPHAPSTGSLRYVEFGYWPQTVKAADVTVYTKLSKEVGMFTYYLGSDGDWYVEQGGNYYKVEPIVWRVLTENYNSTNNALLLAESVLTGGIPYYVSTSQRIIGSQTVHANNWQYSTIRAWLNGSYEASDTQDKTYTGKGFLQTAFTTSAQDLIAETDVDNSAASTFGTGESTQNNPFASNTPTTDKIFLLSMWEATTSVYGFAAEDNEDSTRIRVTTDYAKATGAEQDSTPAYGGWWWLRSPRSDFEGYARVINSNGIAGYIYSVSNTYRGVVPALCIPANQLP